MPKTNPNRTRRSFFKAFDTLFNKTRLRAAERFLVTGVTSSTARNIAPGREGCSPWSVRRQTRCVMENRLFVAKAITSSRTAVFTGIGRPSSVDCGRCYPIEDGVLKEHWDVLQDEATKAESVSGLPMFGDNIPK